MGFQKIHISLYMPVFLDLLKKRTFTVFVIKKDIPIWGIIDKLTNTSYIFKVYDMMI